MRIRKLSGWILAATVSLLIAVVFLTPFVWILSAAFKKEAEIFASFYPLTLYTFIPKSPTIDNFIYIFSTINFGRNILNSLIVAVSVTGSVLVVNSLAAFAFARLNFPLKNVILAALISTMFLPFEVSMLPMFLVSKSLGLYNSYAAMIVPWIGLPFGIFLLRQFFLNIPRDLDDAAVIDGCSVLGIYRHVVVPNSKPALITLGLIQFLWSWDSFFWPLITVEVRSKQVIQVAIATLMDPEYLKWGPMFAAVSVAALPIIILFLLAQKYYVQGLIMTGMKA
jgi:ABC-type glycerol-3-phosphate transport system permease component